MIEGGETHSDVKDYRFFFRTDNKLFSNKVHNL